MRKKETTATERLREKEKEKKRRSSGENERQKRNPEEREIIDKISSCSNILMQEIRLLMFISQKKKKKGF